MRTSATWNRCGFPKESLDDSWYQLGLTLNAATPIGDLVLAASYFDRDFHYEADATDYEWNFNCPRYDSAGNQNPPPPACQPNYAVYDFGGDPRGFAQNDEQTEITTFEARLQSRADEEAAGPGSWALSTARRRGTRSSTAS